MENKDFANLAKEVMASVEESGITDDIVYLYDLALRNVSARLSKLGVTDFTPRVASDLLSESHQSQWAKVWRRRIVRRLCEHAGIVEAVFPKADLLDSYPERFRSDLEGFRAYEQARNLAALTVKHRIEVAGDIVRFLEARVSSLADIGAEEVEAIFAHLHGTMSALTAHARHSDIREFLKFLDAKYEMGGSALDSLPERTKPVRAGIQDFFSQEELRLMLEAAAATKTHPRRTFLVVSLLIQYPIRNADLRRMELGDIDWSDSTLTIRAEKNDALRVYPLTESMRLAIADYLRSERPKSDDPHLILSTKPPFLPVVDSSSLSNVVKRVAAEAGIDAKGRRIGTHMLRRSVATTLMEKDVPYPVISEMLMHEANGSAFSQTTMSYLRADIKALRSVALEVPHAL